MSRYHVNPATGKPNLCHAKTPEGCLYYNAETRTEAPHFESKEKAHAYAEKELSKEYKNKPITKTMNCNRFKKEYNKYFKEIEGGLPKQPNPVSVLIGEKPYPVRFRGEDVEKKEDVIKSFGYVPDELEDTDAEYIYVLSTRQGGGNRECYCDDENWEHEEDCIAANNEELKDNPNYIYDEDDTFDSTYATFYFKADKELTEKYFKEKEEYSKLRTKELLKQSIEKGETPPWAIRKEFDQNLHNLYKNSKKKKEQNDQRIKTLNNEIEELTNLIKKVHQKDITRDEIRKGLKLPVQQVYKIPDNLNKDTLQQAKNRLEKAEKILESVNQLPNGDLKEYILSQNSKLKDNIEAYKRGIDNANRGFLEAEKMLTNKKDELGKEKASTITDFETFNKLRKEAWENGYYGNIKNIPKIPENF